MRIKVLGSFQVRDAADEAISLGGRQIPTLLARLAFSPQTPLSSEALMKEVWNGSPPCGGPDTLRRLASRARARLSEYGLNIGPIVGSGGYCLAVEPEEVDALRFEQLASDGARLLRARAPSRALETLDEALELWDGDPLGGIDADFAERTIARLNNLHLRTIEDRFEALLQSADAREAAAPLQAFCQEHPTRERSHQLLMHLLHETGERAGALEVHARLRRALAEEFGVDPSPQIERLHTQILRDRRTESPKGWRNPYITKFFGRAVELEQTATQMSRSRLVTMLGPGGVGKTRLAAEYAETAATKRVCFVELSSLRSDDNLVEAVLAAHGAATTGLSGFGQDRFSRLASSLVTVPTLLVLDNCEHVAESAAQLTSSLLAFCPNLQILATSREPLGTIGEALVRVEPLSVTERNGAAVAMFQHLASLSRPGFAVNSENADATIEICRRLDGLPLAIELAATRMRSMSVHEIARHLDERFKLLSQCRRAGDVRHRTLSAVLDWSWNLLSEPERRLARRLSVLPSGATAESAQALLDSASEDPDDVPMLIAALADKSLLRPVEHTALPLRHRLMETSRAYLQDRLRDAEEERSARADAAHHFTSLAESTFAMLLGRDQARAMTILDDEHENLVESLRHIFFAGQFATSIRFVATLSWYWMIRGRYEDIERWLSQCEKYTEDVPAAAAAVIHALRLVLPRAQETAGVVLTLADVPPLTTESLTYFPPLAIITAKQHLAAGNHASIHADARMALTHSHPWVRASGLACAALVAEAEGDISLAEHQTQAAVHAFREVGDLWSSSQQSMVLAGYQSSQGEGEEAILSLRRSLDLERSLGLEESAVLVTIRLGQETLRAGRANEAEAILSEALVLSEAANAELRLLCLAQLARTALACGQMTACRERYEQARGLLNHPLADRDYLEALLLRLDASLRLAEGDLHGARASADQAWSIATRMGDASVQAESAEHSAEVWWHRADAERASRLLGAAAGFRGRSDDGSPLVQFLARHLAETLGDQPYERAYEAGRSQPFVTAQSATVP